MITVMSEMLAHGQNLVMLTVRILWFYLVYWFPGPIEAFWLIRMHYVLWPWTWHSITAHSGGVPQHHMSQTDTYWQYQSRLTRLKWSTAWLWPLPSWVFQGCSLLATMATRVQNTPFPTAQWIQTRSVLSTYRHLSACCPNTDARRESVFRLVTC